MSLYAKGLTTGKISAHFAEAYGASLSTGRISVMPPQAGGTPSDRVIAEMNYWTSHPLLPTSAAIFIDAIHLKVRDGQVANRAFYAAIGVNLKGLPDSANAVFPEAIIQACLIYVIRGMFRYAPVNGLGPDLPGPQTHLHRPQS